jgi:hypothetical protein
MEPSQSVRFEFWILFHTESFRSETSVIFSCVTDGPRTAATTIIVGTGSRTLPPFSLWSNTLNLASGSGTVQFAGTSTAQTGASLSASGASVFGTINIQSGPLSFSNVVVSLSSTLTLTSTSSGTAVGSIQIPSTAALSINTGVTLGATTVISGSGTLALSTGCNVLGPIDFSPSLTIRKYTVVARSRARSHVLFRMVCL